MLQLKKSLCTKESKIISNQSWHLAADEPSVRIFIIKHDYRNGKDVGKVTKKTERRGSKEDTDSPRAIVLHM